MGAAKHAELNDELPLECMGNERSGCGEMDPTLGRKVGRPRDGFKFATGNDARRGHEDLQGQSRSSDGPR